MSAEERLRARADESDIGASMVEDDDADLADDMREDVALFREAADEIARLREALLECVKSYDLAVISIARRALEEAA